MAFVVGAVVYPNDIKRVVYYQIMLIFCNCSLRLLVPPPPSHTTHAKSSFSLPIFIPFYFLWGGG